VYDIRVRRTKRSAEDIRASLSTMCPKCGYEILPNEILRIDDTQMQRPKYHAIREKTTKFGSSAADMP
jgi:hypothetical protein